MGQHCIKAAVDRKLKVSKPQEQTPLEEDFVYCAPWTKRCRFTGMNIQNDKEKIHIKTHFTISYENYAIQPTPSMLNYDGRTCRCSESCGRLSQVDLRPKEDSGFIDCDLSLSQDKYAVTRSLGNKIPGKLDSSSKDESTRDLLYHVPNNRCNHNQIYPLHHSNGLKHHRERVHGNCRFEEINETVPAFLSCGSRQFCCDHHHHHHHHRQHRCHLEHNRWQTTFSRHEDVNDASSSSSPSSTSFHFVKNDTSASIRSTRVRKYSRKRGHGFLVYRKNEEKRLCIGQRFTRDDISYSQSDMCQMIKDSFVTNNVTFSNSKSKNYPL